MLLRSTMYTFPKICIQDEISISLIFTTWINDQISFSTNIALSILRATHHWNSWPILLFKFTGYSPLEVMTNITYSFFQGTHNWNSWPTLLNLYCTYRKISTNLQVYPSCSWDLSNIYQWCVLLSSCIQDIYTFVCFAFV